MQRLSFGILAGILILVTLYFGAIGPISGLESHGIITIEEGSVVWHLYSPVRFAAHNYPTVTLPLQWYVNLWEPKNVESATTPD
jgi:hypothetical protein